MAKKLRLLIFNRREVILIFILIVLVAVVSFVTGVKMGQKLSYEVHGITPEDQEFVHLKSWEEEDAGEGSGKASGPKGAESQKTLREKFEEIAKMERKGKKAQKKEKKKKKGDSISRTGRNEIDKIEIEAAKKKEVEGEKTEVVSFSQALGHSGAHRGKWIIQLGSYRDLDDAQRFANGFRVRGYRPIINAVVLGESGSWYRVGLGAFDSASEAKDFIAREGSLFQGQDYTIVQLQ